MYVMILFIHKMVGIFYGVMENKFSIVNFISGCKSKLNTLSQNEKTFNLKKKFGTIWFKVNIKYPTVD